MVFMAFKASPCVEQRSDSLTHFQPEGNYYNKYEKANPITRWLMKGFFSSFKAALNSIEFSTVYEAGCGEGYIAQFVTNSCPHAKVSGSDISGKVVAMARERVPTAAFAVESIYNINSPDNAYDLVIASEVLEHLERPADALSELVRISKKYILLSVPNEPLWRVLNMLRLKYITSFGNTPGHVNHWSAKGFKAFVSSQCDIRNVTPPPRMWTMLLCEKRQAQNPGTGAPQASYRINLSDFA